MTGNDIKGSHVTESDPGSDVISPEDTWKWLYKAKISGFVYV